MIGGLDIILQAPSERKAMELILRTVRRHWPACLFEDAEAETEAWSPCPEGWLPDPSVREFFLYRDEKVASSWEKHGASPKNANSMLHVLLGKRRKSSAPSIEITLVCDEEAGEMGEILSEIRSGLKRATAMTG